MGLIKFFAAVFGVSDALSEDEQQKQRAAYKPKIDGLRGEKEVLESALDKLKEEVLSGETTIDEALPQQLLLESKIRDVEKLLEVYKGM